MSITVIIPTKNEEENIAKCIESVNFADEVLILDDDSTDKTVEIARSHGAKIITRSLDGDFASQKNFGLTKATSKWVLFLDADEVVSSQLAEEIMQTLNGSSTYAEGFIIKRHDFLWGKRMKHGEVGNVKLLRLVQKDLGKWKRSVHEELTVRGRVKNLKYPINHYPHQTLEEFIDHIDVWSSWHASAIAEEGKKSSLTKIVIWPIGSIFVNYILRRGYLDGTRGFVLALMMSLHSFLSWGKQWKKDSSLYF